MEFLHFIDLLSSTHPPRSICDSFAASHPLGSSFDPDQCWLTGAASASSHSLLESVSRTEILSFNQCIMPFQSSNDTHNSKTKDRYGFIERFILRNYSAISAQCNSLVHLGTKPTSVILLLTGIWATPVLFSIA